MTQQESTRPSSRIRQAKLLNRAQVRTLILDAFRRTRPHARITRVSQQALDQLEGWLRQKIHSAVSSHPTLGRTFKL